MEFLNFMQTLCLVLITLTLGVIADRLGRIEKKFFTEKKQKESTIDTDI